MKNLQHVAILLIVSNIIRSVCLAAMMDDTESMMNDNQVYTRNDPVSHLRKESNDEEAADGETNRKLSYSQKFYDPHLNCGPIDYCLVWGDHCGWKAAHSFCQAKGYTRAASFDVNHDVGYTQVIADGQVCRHDYCDGFTWIQCAEPSGLYSVNGIRKKFYSPTTLSTPLDWCFVYEGYCGESVAHAYCRMRGYFRATHWQKRHITNTAKTTMTLGDGKVCDPTNHSCDTFAWIECTLGGCL